MILLSVCALSLTPLTVVLPSTSYGQPSSSVIPTKNNTIGTSNTDKIIILSFDDNRKGDITYAKPILDKYGFKATFFVICNKTRDRFSMNWNDIATMQKDGMDIQAHTMTHPHLNHLSISALNREIGGSKECLINHGYNATTFAYPYDEGADNSTVVNIVAKYFSLARSGSEPVLFLNCNGYKSHPQSDCRTTSPDGTLTYANRYAIRSFTEDSQEKKDSFNNSTIYSDFIKTVNSQSRYNNGTGGGGGEGTVNAISLITFHNVLPLGSKPYTTNLAIFDQMMKYLHDNGFRVMSMNNLGYDAKNNVFYVKNTSGT
jgi:peptidoglycan/xylan/chitin deacetylase (PgdA/CDA1 family)